VAKRFPLEIFISATDKATAVLNRVSDRIDRFYQPFNRIKKAFGEFADKTGLTRVGAALKNVGSEALALGRKVAVGLAAATVAIGAFALNQASAADAIGNTSALLNISTDALQAYQYGFLKANVEQQDFIASLDALNKNLGLAKLGAGKALPFFRALALDPKKFKTVDELLPALANRLSRIHDPAKRAAIATKFLGDTGAMMALKLAEGPKVLEQMLEAAKAAGVILSPETIGRAGKFDAAWKSLRATFKGITGNLMGEFYPVLEKLLKRLEKFLLEHKADIEAFARDFGKNLPDNIDKAVIALRDLRDTLKPVMDILGFLIEKLGLGNSVMLLFALIIGGKLLGAIFTLGTALMGLGVSMSVAFGVPALIVAGVAAAVAAGWWLYKNWDKITAWFDKKIEWLREKLGRLWDPLLTGFKLAIDGLKAMWGQSPLGFLFRGIGALTDRIQSASGSAPTTAPPVGGKLLGPMVAPRQQVDVRVDLSNMLPGMRAVATASDGIGLELNRGWAMPGATGSW
jgi:hypothetical protein